MTIFSGGDLFLGVLFYFKCFCSHCFLVNLPVYKLKACVYLLYLHIPADVDLMSDTSFIATV